MPIAARRRTASAVRLALRDMDRKGPLRADSAHRGPEVPAAGGANGGFLPTAAGYRETLQDTGQGAFLPGDGRRRAYRELTRSARFAGSVQRALRVATLLGRLLQTPRQRSGRAAPRR